MFIKDAKLGWFVFEACFQLMEDNQLQTKR
jgi:hypothetical protein